MNNYFFQIQALKNRDEGKTDEVKNDYKKFLSKAEVLEG